MAVVEAAACFHSVGQFEEACAAGETVAAWENSRQDESLAEMVRVQDQTVLAASPVSWIQRVGGVMVTCRTDC